MEVKRGSGCLVKITDKEYNEITNKFDKIKLDISYPTTDITKEIKENVKKDAAKWIPYLIYLAESKKENMTDEEKQLKKELRKLLSDILEIIDSK